MSGRGDDRHNSLPAAASPTDADLAADIREKFRQLYVATNRATRHKLVVCDAGGNSLLGRLSGLGGSDGARLDISRKL